MRKTTTTGLLTAALLFGAAGNAHANDFFLGFDPIANQIEWCDNTLAVTVVVNPGPVLLAPVFFALTAGNDRAQVVRVAGTPTVCGVYNPIGFGGFMVTINGQAGNDIITGGFGPTFVQGATGDDHVTVLFPAGLAAGGQGDDCVRSDVVGGGETMVGALGVDCLEQTMPLAGPAAVFDCGPMIDTHFPGPGTVPVACEVLVAACGCLMF